jgi:hypothetical protein
MRYLQNGGYNSNPFMRASLLLTVLLLAGFVITNFLIFFNRMGFSLESIASYYLGNDEEYRPARSLQSMLEVTHGHLPMMALVLLLLTHLAIFAPLSKSAKYGCIFASFASGLLSEGSGYLVRFVHSDFAVLKLISFAVLQICLIFLLSSLALFLFRSGRVSTHDSSNDE